MSEIGWYKSQLKVARVEAYASNIEQNPSFEILRRAMEMVTREHGGTLSNSVSDSYGRKTDCDLAVVTSGFSRGIGIRIDRRTGNVAFLYDPYGGQAQAAQSIADEITQDYVAICVIRAMKSLGYEVREEAGRE